MSLYHRCLLHILLVKPTIWFLHAWNIGTLPGNGLKTDFKYIKHLSVIALNQICIGFFCVSYLEKVTLQQYHSHLPMFYHLHLAHMFW